MKKSRSDAKQTELAWLETNALDTLRRNPQYLTPKQMESLKASIRRDGFVAPILVRPLSNERYEVVSGNHRLMAARELGLNSVPCVVSDMSKESAQRLAVNLNLIHGDPPAELLAPFLAELDEQVLSEIHLEGDLRAAVMDFDATLADTLASLDREMPGVSNESVVGNQPECICQTCGRLHVPSSGGPRSTRAPRKSSTAGAIRRSSDAASSSATPETAD